ISSVPTTSATPSPISWRTPRSIGRASGTSTGWEVPATRITWLPRSSGHGLVRRVWGQSPDTSLGGSVPGGQPPIGPPGGGLPRGFGGYGWERDAQTLATSRPTIGRCTEPARGKAPAAETLAPVPVSHVDILSRRPGPARS